MSGNGLSPHSPTSVALLPCPIMEPTRALSHIGTAGGKAATVNLDDALAELLRNDRTTGERQDDLVAAAVEAWRRRHVNTEAGAAVLAALADMGLSYRQIQQLTGIPPSTAHRWANPPDQDE